MNASELAKKMLQWEEQKRALDALSAEIESAVIEVGKTMVVGKVRVTYSGGRATYDYVTPAESAPNEIMEKHKSVIDTVDWDSVANEVPEVVAKFTTTEFNYDWKAILEEAKIEPLVISKTEPTAKIKLED